ncbi:CinA family protein [Hyphococcus flavus]|uniref:CinA family protein n=1 Tax=Hyphococcus flavus TaxID=1866326 RepID=A0AAE9ZDR0_9PROT|nr:CinA family protein [Hyphococcus flavus]WDI30783.1 CinA family protein [Hyphococcus flavus]
MTQTHRIWSLAQAIIDKAGAQGLTVATAESCTGGMIAAALTDVPGSSAVVDRGFVTYSNEAKAEMLGVPMKLIEQNGAVSAAVARVMALGALLHSRADIAVSVTGIAGPSGGTDRKPVGLVWFGLADREGVTRVERRVFAEGGRDFVRTKAAETALHLMLTRLNS